MPRSVWLMSLVVAGCLAARGEDAAPPDASEAAIGRLIGQLGDPDFFVRERAQVELSELGFEAFDALEAAEAHDDIEIASRVRYLLRRMRVEWTSRHDPPAVQQLLKDYEQQNEAQRTQVMQQLARLADDAGLPALCRLVRFERTPVASKQAAVQAISAGTAAADWGARQELIAAQLGRCQRPAADWLRTWAAVATTPDEALAAWDKLVAAEQELLVQYPDQSSPAFVQAMIRQEVVWLEGLGRSEDAVAAMRRLVAIERGEPETLIELLTWLTKRQAWAVIDELATRFGERIELDPLLLYGLAEAREKAGRSDAAAELAEKARLHSPGDPLAHWNTALRLRQLGLPRWAEGEYGEAIRIGPDEGRVSLDARVRLAEMLHDRDAELEAAEQLEAAALGMEENIKSGDEEENLTRTPEEVRARRQLFLANIAAGQGKSEEYERLLQRGLELDPMEVDVLIALYRVRDRQPGLAEEVLRKIEAAGDEFRRRIQNEPEESDHYNQLAWLIGNTEGDQDEALCASLKSLELRPDVAGYLDTLGRVYYARGELENAVKHQRRAVELDPHSGLMNKQLELFEQALEAQKAGDNNQ